MAKQQKKERKSNEKSEKKFKGKKEKAIRKDNLESKEEILNFFKQSQRFKNRRLQSSNIEEPKQVRLSTEQLQPYIQRNAIECSICLELIVYPTLLTCGHIFCYKCAIKTSKTIDQCCLCKQKIGEFHQFLAQPTIKMLVEEYVKSNEREEIDNYNKRNRMAARSYSKQFAIDYKVGEQIWIKHPTMRVWVEGKVRKVYQYEDGTTDLQIKCQFADRKKEKIKISSVSTNMCPRKCRFLQQREMNEQEERAENQLREEEELSDDQEESNDEIQLSDLDDESDESEEIRQARRNQIQIRNARRRPQPSILQRFSNLTESISRAGVNLTLQMMSALQNLTRSMFESIPSFNIL